LGTGPSASLWDGARRYVRPWRRCFGKSSKFRQVPLQSEASWRVNPRSRTARPVRFRRGEAFGIRSGVGNEFGVVRARARRRRDCRFSSALFSKTARRDDSRLTWVKIILPDNPLRETVTARYFTLWRRTVPLAPGRHRPASPANGMICDHFDLSATGIRHWRLRRQISFASYLWACRRCYRDRRTWHA
jgi:hypothetical protein